MNELPFISCLMPTYNRYPNYGHLIDEAVQSFINQTYPLERRELVIWNDTPGQILECDYPFVNVINTSRFRSLGEKRNALVGVAKGNILLVWDDDDISLSYRIYQAVGRLCNWNIEHNTDLTLVYGYWNPRHYWFWNNSDNVNGPQGLQIPSSLGYGHNCSAYTRQAFHRVGGYPASSGDEDMKINDRLKNVIAGIKINDGLDNLPIDEWSYIYRLDVFPNHLSGVRDTNRKYMEIGQHKIIQGRFTITPKWHQDYNKLVNDKIKELKVTK